MISHNHEHNSSATVRMPTLSSSGTKGCRPENSGHVTGSISVVAFSFMVQDPSVIIVRSSARSRSERRRM
ncbi:MAG: hypothetical protein ACKOQ7_10245 [Actinomycetota bacterium]